MPDLVFVSLFNNPPDLCTLPGLPPNVFPLSAVSKNMTLNLDKQRKRTFKLTQFPLVPSAALTVHKVQGQSLSRVIVGKWRDPKMVAQNAMSAYVMLSRVRTLNGLYITQPLTRADCDHFVPSLEIVAELERLDALQTPALRTPPDQLAQRRQVAAARAQQDGAKKRKR